MERLRSSAACRVFVHNGRRLSIGSRSYVKDCSTLTCFEERSPSASVVTAEAPPGALVAGNPAKVIRHDVSWKQ